MEDKYWICPGCGGTNPAWMKPWGCMYHSNAIPATKGDAQKQILIWEITKTYKGLLRKPTRPTTLTDYILIDAFVNKTLASLKTFRPGLDKITFKKRESFWLKLACWTAKVTFITDRKEEAIFHFSKRTKLHGGLLEPTGGIVHLLTIKALGYKMQIEEHSPTLEGTLNSWDAIDRLEKALLDVDAKQVRYERKKAIAQMQTRFTQNL